MNDPVNAYKAEIFLYKLWRPNSFFQFEIIINVLVSWFIRIPMLWVYVLYKCFTLFHLKSDVYRRQMLTSKVHPRTLKFKHCPVISGWWSIVSRLAGEQSNIGLTALAWFSGKMDRQQQPSHMSCCYYLITRIGNICPARTPDIKTHPNVI